MKKIWMFFIEGAMMKAKADKRYIEKELEDVKVEIFTDMTEMISESTQPDYVVVDVSAIVGSLSGLVSPFGCWDLFKSNLRYFMENHRKVKYIITSMVSGYIGEIYESIEDWAEEEDIVVCESSWDATAIKIIDDIKENL